MGASGLLPGMDGRARHEGGSCIPSNENPEKAVTESGCDAAESMGSSWVNSESKLAVGESVRGR